MDPLKTLVADSKFNLLLGMFFSAWATYDLTVDFAIGKFLNLPPTDTQILTSGMLSGTKMRLLYELVGRSNHQNKSTIKRALNKLRNEAKRNVLAHSYFIGDADSITFVERSGGGDYRVTMHRFTLDEWGSHVASVTDAGTALWKALDVQHSELHAFAEAAVKAAKS